MDGCTAVEIMSSDLVHGAEAATMAFLQITPAIDKMNQCGDQFSDLALQLFFVNL